MTKVLKDHQLTALRKLSNGKILWGGVGSGKTLVAAEYYMLKEAPRDVYVITTAKKRDDLDWQEQFYELGIGPRTGPNLFGASETKGRRRNQKSGPAAAAGDRTESGDGGVSQGESTDSLLGRVESTNARSDRSTTDGPSKDSHVDLSSTERGGVDADTTELHRDLASAQRGQDLTESSSRAGRPEEAHRSVEGLRSVAGTTSDDARQHRQSVGSGLGQGSDGDHHFGCTDESFENSSDLRRHRELDVDLRLRSERVVGRVESRPSLQGSLLLEGDPTGGVDDRLGRAGVYPYVLTVDSWNNIAKYADVAGAFFIFDEQRLVGSGDWTRKFLRIAKRNHWILLSATPGDTWMDYVPVFIANGFYKNRTEFKREHVVYNTFAKFPKVDRYIVEGKLVRNRAKLLVHMPYERHTTRRHVEVELPYDKDKLDAVLKQRWHVFEDRPLRDIAEMFSVARRVVNGDPSRLEMVRELWEKHPRLIIFYNFNYELENLRSLAECYGTPNLGTSRKLSSTARGGVSLEPKKSAISLPTSDAGSSAWQGVNEWKMNPENSSLVSLPPGLLESGTTSSANDSRTPSTKLWTPSSRASSLRVSGMVEGDITRHSKLSTSISEWNGHKHQPVPTTDRWLYLVQYTAGAEGWNCVTTDAMIMYSLNYSWKITEQAYGRIDRLNTLFKDLWYYGFTSDSWIDRAITRALKGKENFNEAKFKGMFELAG